MGCDRCGAVVRRGELLCGKCYGELTVAAEWVEMVRMEAADVAGEVRGDDA